MLRLNRYRYSQMVKFDERGFARKYTCDEGKRYGNFEVRRVFPSKEFNLTYYEFLHLPSKATYVHLANSSINNQGALLLHTPPQDQKGLPHIVHRMCLAGSEKYPIRDALSHMHNRSLLPRGIQPYLGPDYTYYPIQSPVLKDFYQLFDLTVDQVFKPWNRLVDFLIEGVRLQILGDELIVRGHVYDEMKNNFNIGEFINAEYVKSNMTRGSIYQYCTGGHPLEMLNLKFEEVQDYYKKHINAANLTIMTQGDFDMFTHLEKFDKVLGNISVGEQVYNGKDYTQSLDPVKRSLLSYPPSHTHSLSQIGLTFKGADLKENPKDYLSLQMLSHFLHNVEGIGFQKYLSEQNPSYIFNFGSSTETRLQYLSIGLGTTNSTKQMEQELINFIVDLKNNPFKILPEDSLVQTMRKLELRKQSNLIDMIPYILHKVDPEYFLTTKANVDLIDRIPSLIQNYLTDYQILIMEPASDYIWESERREKQTLKSIFDRLTDDRIAQMSQEHELTKEQMEQIQTLDSLPSLQISEVLPVCINHPLTKENQTYFQDQNIPGQCEVYVTFDIDKLSNEELKIVNLIRAVQPYLFEQEHIIGQLETQIIDTLDGLKLQYRLLFLEKDSELNLARFFECISDPDFDDYTKMSYALQVQSALEGNDLIENAAKYSIDSTNTYGRLDQVRDICKIQANLLKIYDTKPQLDKLQQKIIPVYFKLMNKNKLKVLAIINQQKHSMLRTQVNLFAHNSSKNFEDFNLSLDEFDKQYEVIGSERNSKSDKIYYIIPSGCNYVTESIKVEAKFGSQWCPIYHVLASQLTTQFLSYHVNENLIQTSAYFCPIKGQFTFYTYRDQKTLQSYQIFEQALQELLNTKGQNLNEAKISLVRRLYERDSRTDEFINNITPQQRANYIASLLSVSELQIIEAGKQLLKQIIEGNTKQVIFGMQQKGLETLVKRGWLIERLLEDISLDSSYYQQPTQDYYEHEENI